MSFNARNFNRAFRTACSALKEACQASSASRLMADAARSTSKLSSGSQANPVLQAWRQEQAKFAACKPNGMGSFAANGLQSGAPAPAPVPAMPFGNTQVRGASTTAVTEGAEDEGESTMSSGGSSLLSKSSGDDEDATLAHENLVFRKRKRVFTPRYSLQTKQQRDYNDSESLDKTDPLDFRLVAKESFLKKPIEMIPIPENIREVLYKFHWDKVLVDVRRSTLLSTKGKEELYTAMVAVGNHKGLLGLGLADAATAQDAVAKAHMDSYSNLTSIPLYRGHTIYHRIDHEYHFMKMRLMPRHDGWGVKAADLVSELCGLVGIKNISIKTVGRMKNKFFVAQCLQEALTKQSTPHDGIEGTGIYVREIFNARGDALPMGLRRGVHVM